MVKITPKNALLKKNDGRESDLDNFRSILNSKISEGLPFGEAVFSISFHGNGSDIKELLDQELSEGGYDFTSTYESFGIEDGFAEDNAWSRANYTIPLGEKKTFNCKNCGGELKCENGLQSTYQFDNALWIGFFGGYGMFVESDDFAGSNDDMQLAKTGASFEVVLCHDCAHKLCDLFPAIGEVINPYSSHAHTQNYQDAHPDHYGWDYDNK